jgi:hypothetical protein
LTVHTHSILIAISCEVELGYLEHLELT